MTENNDLSRRNGAREPIELRVDYTRVNTFLADYTRNISEGGTFIATERPLPQGTEFMFALHVPHLANPLRLRGKVMWLINIEDASDERPAGMGIEFLYQNDAEREKFRFEVFSLLREQLGEHVASRLEKI